MSDIDPKEFGALQAEVAHLRRDMDEMRDDIKKLVALAERSKGGLWVGMGLAGTAGGMLTWLGERLLK